MNREFDLKSRGKFVFVVRCYLSCHTHACTHTTQMRFDSSLWCKDWRTNAPGQNVEDLRDSGMICVSVAPESRRLAKADLLNAAKQCDLIELCLDRFKKSPDIGELIDGISKPVLVSCRNPKEGGHWSGGESERIRLLTQASQSGAKYVELDHKIADQVPVSASCQRVISFTSLDKPLAQLDTLFDRAASLSADVIKCTWPTPTLDAVWPLVSIVSKQKQIPVVGMGLGRAGLTFSLLGPKYRSPWVYAALEKGMEAHEGQASLSELDNVHDWRNINTESEFVAVVGFGSTQKATIATFNSAFRRLDLNMRCLPLEIGKFNHLSDMLGILNIRSVVSSRHLGEHILPLAEETEHSAYAGRNADLLIKKSDGWHAYNSIWRSSLKAMERLMRKEGEERHPIEGRDVLILGSGPLAQTMTYGVQHREGSVTMTSRHMTSDEPLEEEEEEPLVCNECGATIQKEMTQSQRLAELFQAKFIDFDSIYDHPYETVIFADPKLEMGYLSKQLNPSFFNSRMTVMDVTALHTDSELISEARLRGCRVVEPTRVFEFQVGAQFKSIFGQEIPWEAVIDGLDVQG